MNTIDDEQLHRLVAAAQPPSPTRDLAVLASLADLNRQVGMQYRAQAAAAAASTATADVAPRRGRRRSTRSTRIAVLVVAGTLVTGTAAAAAVHAARTGLFGASGMTENDTTEWLDPSADDFPQVAAGLAPDYVTYAPVTDAAAATSWVVERTRSADARVQETLVARTYATYGQCSWLATWQTTQPGDPAHTRAAQQLDASAAWPVFAATDGGGVVAAMTDLARAANAEDSARVGELAPMACSDDLLADLARAQQ